jgi:hypothetical protein
MFKENEVKNYKTQKAKNKEQINSKAQKSKVQNWKFMGLRFEIF